jgi:short-subunit dehydrogenase
VTKPNGQTVLIVGASSDIGQALARAYAEQSAHLIFAARQSATLAPLQSDLELRHGDRPELIDFDLLADEPESLVGRLSTLPDTVVLMAGILGDQQEAMSHPEIADRMIRTNFVAPARLLLAFGSAMKTRGHGTIVGVSSVAGDRGRGSNFIYGSAKAGLTAFLSGLRNALFRSGVHVITVKPGFVRTRMTDGMRLPAALTAEPEEVARAIVRAQAKRRDSIYVRVIWGPIMAIIRGLPEPIFKRLSL